MHFICLLWRLLWDCRKELWDGEIPYPHVCPRRKASGSLRSLSIFPKHEAWGEKVALLWRAAYSSRLRKKSRRGHWRDPGLASTLPTLVCREAHKLLKLQAKTKWQLDKEHLGLPVKSNLQNVSSWVCKRYLTTWILKTWNVQSDYHKFSALAVYSTFLKKNQNIL